MPQYHDVSLFIDGAWGPAAAGHSLPVVNPATGEPIGTVAHAERLTSIGRWRQPRRASRSGARCPPSIALR
jgi:acyl-CoA reductase-like NAD-dependent aldehyde dehydrogenase